MLELFECPNCSNTIKIEVELWSGWTVCPFCSHALIVEYDYYIVDDDECYYYNIILATERQDKEDYFENEKQ